jgi:hypothetical protein
MYMRLRVAPKAPAAPQVFSVSGKLELALLLLVLRVFADNHDATLALDHFALLANGFHRRSDFHCGFSSLKFL